MAFRRRHGFAFFLFVSAASPAKLWAASCIWSGGSNDFASAAHWNCGRVPGSGDNASITTSTVTVSDARTIGEFSLSGTGALTIASTGSLALSKITSSRTITVNGGELKAASSAALSVSGAGTISLASATSKLFYGSNVTMESPFIVTGRGTMLGGTGTMFNKGSVTAAGGGLTIDASGGAAGLATGAGFGTNSSSAFYNIGTIGATTGAVTLAGGLYENGATGIFQTGANALSMVGGTDLSLVAYLRNLINGTLSLGTYDVTSTAAMSLRGAGSAGGIVTIGNSGSTTDTIVKLSNASALLNATDANGTFVELASSLAGIARSGRLELTGRAFNATTSAFALDGSLSIGANASFTRAGGGGMIVSGSGTIAMAAKTSALFNGTGAYVLNGVTVNGTGTILNNSSTLVNRGIIDGSTGTITILSAGDYSGLGSGVTGVGSTGAASVYNDGTIRSSGNGQIELASGIYENSATGVFAATGNASAGLSNSIVRNSLTMDCDACLPAKTGATLLNLSGGQLWKGIYEVDSTAISSGSVMMLLRGVDAVNGIVSIGASGAGSIDTIVQLAGNASTLYAGPTSNHGIAARLEDTLQTINSSGMLQITSGKVFTSSQTALTINGILQIANATYGFNNGSSGIQTVSGIGQVQLLPGGIAFQQYAAVLGPSLTVSGSGMLLGDVGMLDNQGLIRAGAGEVLTIDPFATSVNAGIFGTSHASFYNEGMTASTGGTMVLNNGTYENSLTGVISATGGGSIAMQSGSSLSNLGTSGVLSGGVYTAGTNSTIALRGTAAITAIGKAGSGTTTVVSLSGIGSLLQSATTSATGFTALDASLTSVGATGRLEILDGRSFSKGASVFTNNGTIELGSNSGGDAGSWTSGTLTNNGLFYGFGAANAVIANGTAGIVRASNATLSVRQITGTGTATIDNGASLALTGGALLSQVATLINNGTLVLNDQTITVKSDYQNAAFGSGNAFNARANVSGTGVINASSATQTLSATGLTGTTLDLGVTRVGSDATRTLTITNNGTDTMLRGAVTTTNAPGVTVAAPDFAVAAKGGTQAVTIGYGVTSGSLAGQSLLIANNFANVGNATISLTGKAYAPAVASLATSDVHMGLLRPGTTAAGTIITNTVSGALTDSLFTTVSSVTGGFNASAPGALAQGMSGTLSFQAAAQPGYQSGVATLAFASHDSDLTDLALASQQVNVDATVTEIAKAAFYKAGGAGILTGSGTSYQIYLGGLTRGSDGTLSLTLGVLNDILAASYAEALGGSFSFGGGSGYSFIGDSFTGIAAGSAYDGAQIVFNPEGLATGSYSAILDLDLTSHIGGLDDLALQRIRFTIHAGVAAVPESATWLQMIAGFGLVGFASRRRRIGVAA
jgi:hypothetical protein